MNNVIFKAETWFDENNKYKHAFKTMWKANKKSNSIEEIETVSKQTTTLVYFQGKVGNTVVGHELPTELENEYKFFDLREDAVNWLLCPVK